MEALRQQFPVSDFALLAAVLLLPLLGAFVNGVFGKRLGKEGVRLMALVAIGGSFFASLLTFLLLPSAHGAAAAEPLRWTAWNWFSVHGRAGQVVPIEVGFRVDGMTAVMMLVVTGVGFLIHVYATEYMRKDPGYHRFFAYMNLFCFAMLVLIMADNLALLFVGWEGVGLCSYLLIGFWFTEEQNATAGKKAFIVNRIGDFGLLLATVMLIYYCGALRWEGIAANSSNLLSAVKIWPIGNLPLEGEWLQRSASSPWPAFLVKLVLPQKPVMVYASTLVGLAIFLGAAGKSAQIPLYVWLPDAMAGPTPVSALIHAATMVTAGVYLVARMAAVFVLSPAAMATVAVAGAATAIFAASIGLFQNDLKRVLAYSTVSQLGFMFIGVGVGAFSAGFFHVITHAFFKACLFLGAGSVIHAMHARIHDTTASQDIRNMGGLRNWLPHTRWTFLIACCAIAGLPGLSGFWSKDEILWKAFSSRVVGPEIGRGTAMWQWPSWLGPALYVVGILAATMTAFYMFRAYFMTFHGQFRGWRIVRKWQPPAHHDPHDEAGHEVHERPGPGMQGPLPHESPLAMTVPLMVLAAFAIFAGFLYAEPIHVAPLSDVLDPVFGNVQRYLAVRPESAGLMWPMMAPGLGAFLGGTGAAIYVYWNRQGAPEVRFAQRWPRLYRLIYDKWRIDELYDATVVGMVDALADIFTMADAWIIDGVVAKLTAAVVGFTGTVLRALQTGRAQVYAALMVVGMAGIGMFTVLPHANVSVDDGNLRQTGQVLIKAAPGPGYSYKWAGTGVPTGPDFSKNRQIQLELKPGEKKDIVLTVRNAFHSEATETITVVRPGRPGGPGGPAGVQMRPQAPGGAAPPQAPQLPPQGAR
jgi:NADH-quinone oxidoreductase subunit L